MLLIAAVLLAAASADCADPKTPYGRFQIERGEARSCDAPVIPDRPPTPKEQTRIKTYFDAVMFDGPSARWRFDKVRSNALVCGFVNAKNQLGGYTGWTPFSFDLKEGRGTIYQDKEILGLFKNLCLTEP